MQRSSILIWIFLIIVFFGACSDGNNENRNLPVARGKPGEILLVIDSVYWQGPLGEELKQIFRIATDNLPQDEPMFTLHYVNPLLLNDLLRRAKNMVFVTVLDGQGLGNRRLKSSFTKESIKKIEQNEDLFMFTKKDEYASGQRIVHLFGETAGELIDNLRENREQLRDYFNDVERERLIKDLYGAQEQTKLEETLLQEHQFSIRIPFNYKLAKNEDNFVWLRQLGPIEKNVYVYYKNYDSEGLFSADSIISLRESIGKEYIFDKDKKSLYLTTQRIVPLDTTVVNFNGKYAVKSEGLWKLSDNSLGGPFVSYTFVDETLGRLYYIEGYVAAPGKDKREPMREVQAILSTFRTKTEAGK